MKEMNWFISMVFMTICTITDIKNRTVSGAALIVFGILSLIYMLVCRDIDRYGILYSLLPGAFLLAVSLCSKESIGYGDGFLLLILGAFMGFEICFMTAVSGFLLSALTAVVLLMAKRVNGKSRMPFAPFLTLGLGVSYAAQNML